MVSVALIIAALFGYNQVTSVRAEEDEAARTAAEEEYERLRTLQEADSEADDDGLYIEGGWAGSFAKKEGSDEEAEEEDGTEAETGAEAETGIYADGIYTGEGTGFGGIISVQVTVREGFITDVEILLADDEDGAYLTMAEDIIEDILKAQSADVDTVSGATFSSSGIRDAAAQALEEAVK